MYAAPSHHILSAARGSRAGPRWRYICQITAGNVTSLWRQVYIIEPLRHCGDNGILRPAGVCVTALCGGHHLYFTLHLPPRASLPVRIGCENGFRRERDDALLTLYTPTRLAYPLRGTHHYHTYHCRAAATSHCPARLPAVSPYATHLYLPPACCTAPSKIMLFLDWAGGTNTLASMAVLYISSFERGIVLSVTTFHGDLPFLYYIYYIPVFMYPFILQCIQLMWWW